MISDYFDYPSDLLIDPDHQIEVAIMRIMMGSHLQVMDAFGYAGLPQRRERLWIVGTNKFATRSAWTCEVGNSWDVLVQSPLNKYSC